MKFSLFINKGECFCEREKDQLEFSSSSLIIGDNFMSSSKMFDFKELLSSLDIDIIIENINNKININSNFI